MAEQPLVFYVFHEFANFISKSKFMDYYNKHALHHPWIPQTMLAMLQQPLSMMTMFSCIHKYLATVMTGNTLDATEFVEVKVTIQDMIHDLKAVSILTQQATFSQAHHSFGLHQSKLAHPPKLILQHMIPKKAETTGMAQAVEEQGEVEKVLERWLS
eukprot:191437-Ditylum_brightwellii.AAC.1